MSLTINMSHKTFIGENEFYIIDLYNLIVFGCYIVSKTCYSYVTLIAWNSKNCRFIFIFFISCSFIK